MRKIIGIAFTALIVVGFVLCLYLMCFLFGRVIGQTITIVIYAALIIWMAINERKFMPSKEVGGDEIQHKAVERDEQGGD